jgi:hypothetical protein
VCVALRVTVRTVVVVLLLLLLLLLLLQGEGPREPRRRESFVRRS